MKEKHISLLIDRIVFWFFRIVGKQGAAVNYFLKAKILCRSKCFMLRGRRKCRFPRYVDAGNALLLDSAEWPRNYCKYITSFNLGKMMVISVFHSLRPRFLAYVSALGRFAICN